MSLPTARAAALRPSFQLVLFRPPRSIAPARSVDCSSRSFVCFELPALAGRRPARIGPCRARAFACAGSGKTMVVARRVAQLLSHSRAFASSMVRWRSASAGRFGLAVSSDRSEDDQRTRSFGRGCAKTSARFRTDLFRSLLRGLKALRIEKIAKNFALLDPLQIFAEFLHGLDPKRAFPFGPGTKRMCQIRSFRGAFRARAVACGWPTSALVGGYATSARHWEANRAGAIAKRMQTAPISGRDAPASVPRSCASSSST